MKTRQVAPLMICLLLAACAVAGEPGETRITVDGQADDWTGRDPIFEDPAGDSEPGCLDLTTIYAFTNRDALYLLVEFDDPALEVEQFDIDIQRDEKKYLVSWAPGSPVGGVGEVTGDGETDFKLVFVGDTVWSSFVLDDVFEARIDRRDLGSPESLELVEVRVMVGECCLLPEWHGADIANPLKTPVVNEIDAPLD
jgi:hypothetical protein